MAKLKQALSRKPKTAPATAPQPAPMPVPGGAAADPVTSFSVSARSTGSDSATIDFLVNQLAKQIRAHLVGPVSGTGELILEAKVTLHQRHYRGED